MGIYRRRALVGLSLACIVALLGTPAGASTPTRGAQVDGPYAVMPAADVERDLTMFGWSGAASKWVALNVPIYQMFGREVGSALTYQPDARYPHGHIEIGPRPTPFSVEHEAHHAWDYRTGMDPAGMLADLHAVATSSDPQYRLAADTAWQVERFYAGDPLHVWHYMSDWLGRRYDLIPPDIRERRFGFAVRLNQRAILPVVTH